MKASVVILNYNGESHLKRFLPSAIEHTPSWAEIIIADNGSIDGSIDLVHREFPSVKTLPLGANYGFAGGYNRALAQLQTEYFVLLNSDVEVTAGWLDALIAGMEGTSEVSAAQPKIRDYKRREHFEYAGASGGFMDRYGYAFCRGRLFDHCERDIAQHDDTREVFWASGACLIIRREAFVEAGGFDESLFAHMEEIDLCWRLKNSGHRIYCFPQSVVYHLGGGTLHAISPRKTYLNFRNNLAIMIKNDHRRRLFRRMVRRLLLDGLAGLYLLFRKGPLHFLAVLRAHFSFYFRLGSLLRQRAALKAQARNRNRTAVYRSSIVRDFYFRQKKVFGALESRYFIRQDRVR